MREYYLSMNDKLAGLMLFCSGACALTIPSGYSVAYVLSLFLWVGWWFKKNDQKLNFSPLFPLSLPFLVYASVGLVLSFIQHDNLALSFDIYVRYACAPLIAWVVYRYRPSVSAWWYGLLVGTWGIFFVAIYQKFYLNMERASGFSHPVQFGNLAMLMGFLCFIGAMYYWKLSSRYLKTLFLFSGCVGVFSSLLSGSRGGWIGLPILVCIVCHAIYKARLLSKLQITAVFVIFLIGLSSVLSVKKFGVMDRLIDAHSDLTLYFNGQKNTSLGNRLDLWVMSIQMISEKPYLGWGNHGFDQQRQNLIREGLLESYLDYSHVHQEFLDEMVKHGTLGLLSLLFLYGGPFLLFRCYYRDAGDDHQIRFLSLGGMFIPLMYIDFGLSQTFLSHNSGRMIYVLWVMILGVLCILHQSKNSTIINGFVTQESNSHEAKRNPL